jgi:hypothetical protein
MAAKSACFEMVRTRTLQLMGACSAKSISNCSYTFGSACTCLHNKEEHLYVSICSYVFLLKFEVHSAHYLEMRHFS